MRLFRLFLVVFCFTCPLDSYANRDSLFNVLDDIIKQRDVLIEQRYQQIEALKQQVNQTGVDSFEVYYKLCQMYQSFNYDMAFSTVQDLKTAASSPTEYAQAMVEEAFVLLSAGLFREAIDVLNRVDAGLLSDYQKSFYFYNLARSHFDLADFYDADFQQANAVGKGQSYLDSAIFYAADFPLRYLSYQGLKYYKDNDRKRGIPIYKKLINMPNISNRQLAVEYSTLSSFYQEVNADSLVFFMLKAAIADEQSLVREGIALLHLAKYSSDNRDFERASRYINLALEDANFFGARHRKMQILGVLPLIEAQRLALEKSKRLQFIVFSIILTILLFAAIVLLIRIFKQKGFIEQQNEQIRQQNINLKNKEAIISGTYQKLELYAQQLVEAERLKEQYIGFFFQSNTALINKAQSIFRKSEKQIAEGKFSEAIFTLKTFNAKHQKKKLLTDFDAAFLTVFPTFIQQVNLLFPKSEQYQVVQNNILNTELRIFALVRLGIQSNEIAKILNYSVNTIYAYKTKIRNKSLLEGDAFDAAIMSIQSVSENS